jgi:hypothetical protein
MFGTERCQKGDDVTTCMELQERSPSLLRSRRAVLPLLISNTGSDVRAITACLVFTSIKNIPNQEYSSTEQGDPEIMLKT